MDGVRKYLAVLLALAGGAAMTAALALFTLQIHMGAVIVSTVIGGICAFTAIGISIVRE